MNQPVSLCPIIEGVQFPIHAGNTTLRGLILREALEAFCEAGDSPQSWLQAYAAHADLIHAVALLQHRRRPAEAAAVVVLRTLPPQDLELARRAAAAGASPDERPGRGEPLPGGGAHGARMQL